MNCYTGCFAGIPLCFSFHHQAAAGFYGDVLHACAPRSDCIAVPPEEIRLFMKRWSGPDPAYMEYTLSCSHACDVLMRDRRVVFHGAAFLWHGRAYLFSAPSGTGKTTQLKLWKEMFGAEVEILNGDKPILELTDRDVLVHPSPWKGKEGLGRDDLVAPLSGIVLLQQDSSNSIAPISGAEAAAKLFGRIYSTFTSEEDVLRAAGILDGILQKTPVWLLRNLGDKASALLTYQTLTDEERGEHV